MRTTYARLAAPYRPKELCLHRKVQKWICSQSDSPFPKNNVGQKKQVIPQYIYDLEVPDKKDPMSFYNLDIITKLPGSSVIKRRKDFADTRNLNSRKLLVERRLGHSAVQIINVSPACNV